MHMHALTYTEEHLHFISLSFGFGCNVYEWMTVRFGFSFMFF